MSFLNLKCLVNANPNSNIEWFKDSVPLDASIIQSRILLNNSMSDSELHFEPVSRHDAGLYACKATNNVGESEPASYRLDVQCS